VQVRDRDGKAFDAVLRAANLAGLGPDEDAVPGERRPGLPLFVPDHRDRLGLTVNLDGNAFASTEEGKALTEDEQWAKLARIVEVAAKVWGG
jgi:hypothetical protein